MARAPTRHSRGACFLDIGLSFESVGDDGYTLEEPKVWGKIANFLANSLGL